MSRTLLEAATFAGEDLKVYRHGPDVEIEINGFHHGVFLSPAAAISSAQKHITRTLDEKKPTR